MKGRLLSVVCALSILTACTEKGMSGNYYTDYVNVFVGTGGHGHTFPGAALPHGMVQLSPDTRLEGWDACGGYYYEDSVILGFTHTHLSGTGRGDCGDILFMPVSGDREDYSSRFSHANEQAEPGYYRVLLDDGSIDVELTATRRAGMHCYSWSEDAEKRVVIDLGPTIHGHPHPVTEIRILNDSTVCGMKYTEGWAKRHYVYFYAVFSRPFAYELYADSVLQEGKPAVSAVTTKAVLKFPGGERRILVKVGISGVDGEGARKNVETEIPHWDFARVVREADEIWNRELGVVDVETEDDTSRRIFYTSLYHTALHPSVSSDVDGRFRRMDLSIARDTAYTNYSVFSLWDTFRALHPLYTVVRPELDLQLVRSLLRKYDEMGILPKWELASNETGTMIGYHAVPVIVDAWMKGLRGFDGKKALEACIRSSVYDTTGIDKAMNCSIKTVKVMPEAIRYKNELGYIPCDKFQGETVSMGLEYAYDDWLIARLAEDLGNERAREEYDRKGKAWKNYFDPETKMMRARLNNGKWREPFDPKAVVRPGDYIEGNAWQWAWFVPHDVNGLVEAWGGPERFGAGLDSLFSMSPVLTGDKEAALDVTGMIGQYAHGNEPGHHVPYLYNSIGQYHKTQALVDSIMHTLYRDDPDGLCGNEDAGQMSAWYVLSSMGFYPVCPGKPEYALGRPLFDKVTVRVPGCRPFIIRAENNSRENKYVERVDWNGVPIKDMVLPHSYIREGGTLTFRMADN